MNFDNYLNQAWDEHKVNPEKVAEGFPTGLKLISKNEQIPQFINIVTHVFGEHLGQWEEGLQMLKIIEKNNLFEPKDKPSLIRSQATLEVASQKKSNISDLSDSDQIRVLASVASILTEQSKTEQGQKYFLKALTIINKGLSKDDPANRTLAIVGNNLACSLEEKEYRSNQENEFMILAAKTARKYWELIGTWVEVKIAEYRLAMTYIKADNLEKAFSHAQTCIELSHDNNANPRHLFFAYEALATVEKENNNQIGFKTALDRVKAYFEDISNKDKAWCKKSLEKLMG